MNIFKRLFRIGQAEIHSVLDGVEDPVQITELGIMEMKENLSLTLESLAKIKAMSIRTKNDKEKKRSEAQEYENKAVLLISKAQKGEVDITQAERLAKEALLRKKQLLSEISDLDVQRIEHENVSSDIQKNIEILKFNIAKWENELKTLKAKIRIGKVTQELNKQMAQIDSNSTVNMLERIKEKIAEEDALTQAYASLNKCSLSMDDEIDRVIGEDTQNADAELDEIKRKLGMQ
ncbi:phage shock protein A [Dysgonomonas alginatilytica]|uniref:Phage shock protein A n=1 Tax=Dysgonomonas alginatilytica TaxID=1605892 RepID=A0A2V3PM23_9BACT|nr:PspA/IM30 family protein [Dysgonomonas alginatilytica]PXV60231.1 phage shock protein A [Dysgonomonas alginatilytica]